MWQIGDKCQAHNRRGHLCRFEEPKKLAPSLHDISHLTGKEMHRIDVLCNKWERRLTTLCAPIVIIIELTCHDTFINSRG